MVIGMNGYVETLFKNSDAIYRGAPLWAWNCKLTKELIKSQIECFAQMGFGGFFIHPRTGLDTAYMEDEFMDMVEYAEKCAEENGLMSYLYDEDRYPSGAAGGRVTENALFRQRYLLLTQNYDDSCCCDYSEYLSRVEKGEKVFGYFLTAYDIKLDDVGCISEYCRIDKDKEDYSGHKWYAFVKLSPEAAWYNYGTYIDIFNEHAVEEFIKITHERYYRRFGDRFGKTIPAIFTDEPQMTGKKPILHPFTTDDISLAYTDNLNDSFKETYGKELLDVLPELIWELPADEKSVYRYQYHNHLADRFKTAFTDKLGQWCDEHKLNFTGHLMGERTLWAQTNSLSEAMRLYKGFQWPGVDILRGQKEFTTVKQAVSVARQCGKERVLCEMYGALHWSIDFREFKLQGDWLAALGINFRCPHLSYLSMEGMPKETGPLP